MPRPTIGDRAMTCQERRARRSARLRALEAENDALRRALRCIAADMDCPECGTCRECATVARDALEAVTPA